MYWNDRHLSCCRARSARLSFLSRVCQVGHSECRQVYCEQNSFDCRPMASDRRQLMAYNLAYDDSPMVYGSLMAFAVPSATTNSSATQLVDAMTRNVSTLHFDMNSCSSVSRVIAHVQLLPALAPRQSTDDLRLTESRDSTTRLAFDFWLLMDHFSAWMISTMMTTAQRRQRAVSMPNFVCLSDHCLAMNFRCRLRWCSRCWPLHCR